MASETDQNSQRLLRTTKLRFFLSWQKVAWIKFTAIALLNTVGLNNMIHFGLRGCKEQKELRWVDTVLKTESDGKEYLEYFERKKNYRTGEDSRNQRPIKPRMYANQDVTKTGNEERGTGSGEREAGNGKRKPGNELSGETSTKIQNGGPKNEREKEEDKERNSCLGWNQVGTKLQIRLTFYVYVLSRWYVFSIFNLFHLQYDKVLGLSIWDTWHTHITPGLLRLL